MQNDKLDKNLKPVETDSSEKKYISFAITIFIVLCLSTARYVYRVISSYEKIAAEKSQTAVPADFSQYMKNFQAKIKSNWQPPKNDTSQTVVLLITIDKNGYVVRNVVKKSSENAEVDKAAIDAVKKSEPFDTLPSDYKENTVDIEFAFNYNIMRAN